jgi:hypothetical protein
VSTILRRLLWPLAACVALSVAPASSLAAIRLSPVGNFSAPTSVAAGPGDVQPRMRSTTTGPDST